MIADHDDLKQILNQAIGNYKIYVGKAMMEIKQLRNEVGEL